MAIRHLGAAAVAATLSLVACGGTAEPEPEAAETGFVTAEANPTPTPTSDPTWDAWGDVLWSSQDWEAQNVICALLLSGNEDALIEYWTTEDGGILDSDDFEELLAVARPDCESREDTPGVQAALEEIADLTEPETDASQVDWDKYPPATQSIIEEEAASGDCAFLQDSFDVWANASETYPGGTADILQYLDDTMESVGCYE